MTRGSAAAVDADRVLVTGASGFVGAAVARAVRRAGYRTRVLVRPTSASTNIAGQDFDVALGDLRDPASLDAALRGVRFVFHVAADYRLWAADPEEIVRANREGTGNIMEAALRAGVERVVYTSSVATLRVGDTVVPVDESRPATAEQTIGAYKRSKVVAERLVETMVAERGLPAVIVNPSTPIGPRDVRPTPTGRIIVEAARGRMPAFVDTGLNFVHVDDVAEGHLLALTRGQLGRRYILGGEDVMLGTLLAEIAARTGRRAPTVRLPRAPLYPLAALAEFGARFTGKEPLLTRDALRMSRYRMFFDSSRAKLELGYRARPYVEGLQDALDWFDVNGYLR
ncbi:dihydroflavonol-4-reductase [Chitinasiproducens palmae]|uniref:Dihydroflavonol-4-reductase n=2 Tax=Chitinasiproducens palmae TaxID=1770053 RepID=A0A1H2PIW1_9BURK|nr:dihydroflavonol-4-reductase [Chitinasiproducens palmae]